MKKNRNFFLYILSRSAKRLRRDYFEPAEGTPSAEFLKNFCDRIYIFCSDIKKWALCQNYTILLASNLNPTGRGVQVDTVMHDRTVRPRNPLLLTLCK